MQTITTTELRTKTKKLVEAMRAGKRVTLIHRSHVIGIVKPEKDTKIDEAKPVNSTRLKAFLKSIAPKKLIARRDREKIYRQRLEKKYGARIS